MARKELVSNFKTPPELREKAADSRDVGEKIREFRRNFWYFGDKRTQYFFQEFGTLPQLAQTVTRETFDTASLRQRIRAESMVYDSTGWRFIRGESRTFGPDGVTTIPFDTLRDTILTARPFEMVARIKAKEEMSYWELKTYIRAAQRRGEQVQKFLGELDFKVALPFMNFIVILLGIAITARAGRKGFAVLFFLGLVMVFTYWLISRFAIVIAQNGQFPTIVGAWIGNALFFLLGLGLFRRASR
jgi:lipopolysaccharide export system permease protein